MATSSLTMNAVILAAICTTISQCIQFDPCSQETDHGIILPRDVWIHRSNASLIISEIDQAVQTEAQNYHAIKYVTVPTGVILQVCEPDFAILRAHKKFDCNVKSLLEFSCSDEICTHEIAGDRYQMIRYTLAADFGCFASDDVTVGHKLSKTSMPNQIVQCVLPAFGSWSPCALQDDNCCVFSCSQGYQHNGTACVPACTATSQSCENGQYAMEICTDMTTPRYVCAACAVRKGSQLSAWRAQEPDVCSYQICSAGYFGQNNICSPCPENTFSSHNASECTPCAIGYKSAQGAAECIPCNLQAGACFPGFRHTLNVSEAVLHFQHKFKLTSEIALREMRHACDTRVACLACLPGQFQSDNKCELCDVGYYQPHFAATHCFACAAGHITLNKGSTSDAECLCNKGFE